MTNQAPPRTDVASLTYDEHTVDLPIVRGSEDELAADISKLRSDTGLITLDPGYGNTGATRSAITFLDGELGILRYRGYPIEELAERSTFLEVAYLLIHEGGDHRRRRPDRLCARLPHRLRRDVRPRHHGRPAAARAGGCAARARGRGHGARRLCLPAAEPRDPHLGRQPGFQRRQLGPA